ncbi:GNAT family N-acetyltransferase [Bacillus solimangrovi]|uniref:GNAT family N-acetyltransferase n=1 Tax=Bacillus solimangrovi TaxID=1305675 RepID=A0A1E5LEM9_9BACI|nr:GNAT family N-acetyltransferase [Bacillus solimangrovi]OEH92519.1 GNAT family N-acetyltransferase [Bacillus solimangrovi]
MIREANVTDVNELARLMGELGYPTSSTEMEQRFSSISSNRSYKTFVYDVEQQLVGMIGMMLAHRYEKNESYVWGVAFVVDSTYRGQGIGNSLLLAAEQWAKERGANMITLNSGNRNERQEAHRFYTSRGFEGKATGYYKVLD